MKLLEERIRKDGVIRPGNVLKVDSFLNHQIDPVFLDCLAEEFQRLYAGEQITKILTIEASGIGIASLLGLRLKVPVVFAKKSRSSNLSPEVYHTSIHSYTHNRENTVVVAKQYLSPQDRLLIVDDFLANGCALEGLLELANQAGASVAGMGIVVEKGFQKGGDRLRSQGLRVESLAIVEEMDAEQGKIRFR